MKKYLFVFTMLLAFGLISTKVSAQLTISTINVVNNTGCVITVEPKTVDLNCRNACSDGQVNVNPNSHVAVPFFCPFVDAMSGGYITIIGVFDPVSGSGVKVGNGCGTTTTGQITDCQGITRTVTFTPPATLTIQ